MRTTIAKKEMNGNRRQNGWRQVWMLWIAHLNQFEIHSQQRMDRHSFHVEDPNHQRQDHYHKAWGWQFHFHRPSTCHNFCGERKIQNFPDIESWILRRRQLDLPTLLRPLEPNWHFGHCLSQLQVVLVVVTRLVTFVVVEVGLGMIEILVEMVAGHSHLKHEIYPIIHLPFHSLDTLSRKLSSLW